MTYWIDTHCHMNDEIYRRDFSEYMKRALKMNVCRSLVVCMNREDLEWTFDIQKQFPHLDIAFGYHPEDAARITEKDLEYMREIIKDPRIKVIGEIGLDYYWDKTFMEKQKSLFVRQIQLANEAGKPIQIHSRSAVGDTYDILKKHAETNVLLHCFGESGEMMREYLKLGCYIAFGGTVTFKNARVPRENAAAVPLNRLMIETDCPYMTPVPYRGQTNETAYASLVGEFVAELRGISAEELKVQLMDNYQRFLNGEN